MAFILPHDALTPHYRVAVRLDPATRIVRAAELATYLEAEQIVAAAHTQAEAIREQARAEFESERKRGYEEGTEQARGEAAKHMAEQLLRTQDYLDGVEDQLVDLVIRATRRIIENFTERELAAHAVRKALGIVRNQSHITVRVHPDHIEYVRTGTGELLASYPGVNLLDIVADSRVGRDACILESAIGVVEASAESQLSALEKALRQVLDTTSNLELKALTPCAGTSTFPN